MNELAVSISADSVCLLTKLRIYTSLALSVVLYGSESETWTMSNKKLSYRLETGRQQCISL